MNERWATYILICTKKGSGSWTHQYWTYLPNCCLSRHRRWRSRGDGSSEEGSTWLVPCPCGQHADQPTLARRAHTNCWSSVPLRDSRKATPFPLSWNRCERGSLPRRSPPRGPREWTAERTEDLEQFSSCGWFCSDFPSWVFPFGLSGSVASETSSRVPRKNELYQ